MEIGVDIGGTFTDVVLSLPSGQLRTAKVLTTHPAPQQGVLEGLRKLLASQNVPMSELRRVVHATTLAANAIIERKGARTAMLTTRGFRDLLETGSELRYDLYDLFIDRPPELVPRHLRYSIGERIRYDGTVLQRPQPEELEPILSHLAAESIESVAICFIHSYVNPDNERLIAEAIRKRLPAVQVSASSECVPEIGEYGRFSTTVANAYVRPVVVRYLDRLAAALRSDGFSRSFTVISSNGGALPVEIAVMLPVRLIESGPAVGAHAAAALGQRLEARHLLSLDMGGTTAKVSVIEDGEPIWTTDFEVARLSRFKKGSGLRIKMPTIDMIEIGAGGGSIARVNALGLIEVGPDSAGSDPGPACYGLGGGAATVTDADLLLGYLNPDYFVGGEMALDRAAAFRAVEETVGRPLAMDPVTAAHSIHSIVNENMANAARVYTAERGIDVRSFTLLAFGGAGPVHACAIATRLGIGAIVVPPAGGVLSAVGCLIAPMALDFVRGFMGDLERIDVDEASRLFEDMAREGVERLREAGFARGIMVERSADMRFIGQRSEVNVRLPWRRLVKSALPALEKAFRAVYSRRYGRHVPEVKPEIVNLRVTVRGPAHPLPASSAAHVVGRARSAAPRGRRRVFFEQSRGFVSCPVYDRDALPAGARLVGPGVVEERDSTTVVPPGWRGTVDGWGNLILSYRGRR